MEPAKIQGHVKEIPPVKAWLVHSNRRGLITEGDRNPDTGEPILWPDLDPKEILAVNFMGLVLPPAKSYNFYRTAVATVGSPGIPESITFECLLDSGQQVHVIFHRRNA
ncbi:MAG: hypothetical protein GWN00_01370 [Aliifodinibius sp.]|nr:hypothetical protein [Fodinibius sp.]NIV09982.1 hypothetical protein [Fodinibius sp.]NIY23512.1 hypothetical protein [Fodinibius sp.]